MAQQPPLTPEQLKASPLEGQAFLQLLHRQKVEKYPELPPLYEAIRDGRLRREYLDIWIKDSYPYWDNLHKAIAGTFVKINIEEVRSRLLVKLVNVEGKRLGAEWNESEDPAYEESWLRLGEAIGVPRAEVLAWKPFARTHFALTTLALYSKGYEWTWLDGIASNYAGDLYQHECLVSACDGLRTHYEIPDDQLSFFRAFLANTREDITWAEEQLSYLCCTTERQHTAARAFRERLDIENQASLAPWLANEAKIAGDAIPNQVP